MPIAAGPTIWEMKFPIPRKALELLDDGTRSCAIATRAKPSHPVFIALRKKRLPHCDIPHRAVFRFAHRVSAGPDREALRNLGRRVLDYCRYSANPVGRLVLYLCGYRDAERQRLSDATCTALQLANFWQDVSRDLEKGRIYIPLDALAAHGLAEDDIVRAPV
jgi:phytoene/squalene synthetase